MEETDFRKVTVSFVVRADSVGAITHELQNLDYGIYHMGCESSLLTEHEFAELVSQVPEDILGI